MSDKEIWGGASTDNVWGMNLGDTVLVNVHNSELCAGRNCCLHNPSNHLGVIYFLVEEKTKEVRYIGQTKNPLSVRLGQHISWAKNHQTNVCKWLRTQQAAGYIPQVQAVAAFPVGDLLSKAERLWIAYGRNNGWLLTNQADGGLGGPNRLGMTNTPEHNAKVGLANKGTKHSVESKVQMSFIKRANLPEIERIRGLAAQGGEAASAVHSIPRSCLFCHLEFPSRKVWYHHYIEDHQDIRKERKWLQMKNARDIRWSKPRNPPIKVLLP